MQNFQILKQEKNNFTAVEFICDCVFGKQRFQKSSYLFRQDIEPVESLCYVGVYKGKIVATIRYWEIILNHKIELLLGPIAVLPPYQNQGFARALVEHTIEIATYMEYNIVLLVGDIDYYRRCNFQKVPDGYIELPGETNPERLCYRLLCNGTIQGFKGKIKKYEHNLCHKKQNIMSDF